MEPVNINEGMKEVNIGTGAQMEVTVYGVRPHGVQMTLGSEVLKPGTKLEYEGRLYKVMSRTEHRGLPAINVMPQQHLSTKEIFEH